MTDAMTITAVECMKKLQRGSIVELRCMRGNWSVKALIKNAHEKGCLSDHHVTLRQAIDAAIGG